MTDNSPEATKSNKWQFFIERPRRVQDGIEFVREDVDIFIGTEQEAYAELQDRILNTGIKNGFEPIEELDGEAKK